MEQRTDRTWTDESSGDTQVLRDKAEQLQSTVKDEVVDLRETARGRLEQEVDRRSTEFGSGAREVATAVRGSSSRLRSGGNDLPAAVAEKTADGLERVGSYLEQTDAERLMADVNDLGRRVPWLFIGAGVLAGFGLARVLRASGDASADGPRGGMRP